MTNDAGGVLDKRRVRRTFDRAAETYDAHAVVQRLVADRLLDNLDFIRLAPKTILDIGAGTGYCARSLARRYPRARTVLLDVSPAMLSYARSKGPRWPISGWKRC